MLAFSQSAKGGKIMPVRQGEATWKGNLQEGKGIVKLGKGAFEGAYSFTSRFEEGVGTNPEELLGAAHAGCFSMALSARLSRAGFEPKSVHTVADVHIERVGEGFKITRILLKTEADVPGIDAKTFLEEAETAKVGCPVSQALTGVEISLEAKLL
jgi:osmotically inducible protein OsmC